MSERELAGSRLVDTVDGDSSVPRDPQCRFPDRLVRWCLAKEQCEVTIKLTCEISTRLLLGYAPEGPKDKLVLNGRGESGLEGLKALIVSRFLVLGWPQA